MDDVNYRLGYPKLNSNGVTDSGDDNKILVSPSFMIASQLGAVTDVKQDEAANHCKNYVEVSGVIWKDGKADYTNVKYYKGWRLPTEAEIKIIDKYQNEPNSAIDKVLTGKSYWAASGEVTLEGGQNTKRLRCIRDVK